MKKNWQWWDTKRRDMNADSDARRKCRRKEAENRNRDQFRWPSCVYLFLLNCVAKCHCWSNRTILSASAFLFTVTFTLAMDVFRSPQSVYSFYKVISSRLCRFVSFVSFTARLRYFNMCAWQSYSRVRDFIFFLRRSHVRLIFFKVGKYQSFKFPL